MGLLWYEQPEDSGLHPLYQTSSPTALRVVQAQPFITLEQWSNHRYNRDIPSPPTYGPEPSEVRIIQRTQHLRRSTTPRRNRSPTPVRREHQHRPQQLVPDTDRDITPPRRNVEQPSSSNRVHSATRNKIGHKAAPPQPPAHYIPRTESLTQRHFHGINPFDEDSDGLELPSEHLQISRPVPKTQPPQPTDYQLLPQLRTLVTPRTTSREQSPAKTAATSSEKSQLHTCDISTLQHQENYLQPTTVAQLGNSPATSYTSSTVPASNIQQTSHTVP